jgi:ubiquinone/menaquinone biosynthesis C-methylase UbiE
MTAANVAPPAAALAKPLKLDLGCGIRKVSPDFTGVDIHKFDGVDVECDLAKQWPWEDNSVEEVHCSHLIEHLGPEDRIHFVNELYRVLKPGGKANIACPDYSSGRAYGDLTHKWPPISSFWFYYLSADWRSTNAPHNDKYTCNFSVTGGYILRQDVIVRNQQYQEFAINNFKDVCQDITAIFTKL